MIPKTAPRLLPTLATVILAIAMLACSLYPATSRPASGRAGAISVTVNGTTIDGGTTLDAALSVVRAQRRLHPEAAILIQLPSATYRITVPILLGAAESGIGKASLTIRGAPNGGSVIKGSTILAQLPSPTAAIMPATVAGLSRPELRYRSYLQQSVDAEPLIFDRGRRIDLSRWPARSYLAGWQVSSVSGGTLVSHPDFDAPQGTPVLVVGYLTADWAYEAIPGRTVEHGILLPSYHPAGSPQQRVRLAVMNLDRADGREHYRLADDRILLFDLSNDNRIEIATAPELMVVERANNLTVENVAFEHSVGNALRIYVSSHVTIRNCYVGGTGRHGISVDGGDHVVIDGCVVADTGMGGITLFGGDRTTLTPSGHVVSDTIVSAASHKVRSYSPGVALLGTGNRLTHSLIYGLPHAGVGLSGNDNRIDGNDIHAVACETGDVGAIYMGHDWTQRGNRIEDNFIHDIGTTDPSLGNSAIYLDDQFSGAVITGNVILRSSQGVVIGGGRDNLITGNIFAQLALSAIWLDQRGLDTQKADTVPGGVLYQSLIGSPFRSTLWQSRYPTLASLLKQQPGTPIGNRVSENSYFGSIFIKTSPDGLQMEEQDNRQFKTDGQAWNDLSPDQQYGRLRRRVGNGVPSAMPGPTRTPRYVSRLANIPDCRSFQG